MEESFWKRLWTCRLTDYCCCWWWWWWQFKILFVTRMPPQHTFNNDGIFWNNYVMSLVWGFSALGNSAFNRQEVTNDFEWRLHTSVAATFVTLYHLLTCQRLIFRWYREPATENVTSPQVFTAPEVITRNHDGGNRKPLSLWQPQYGGPNNNMAAK